MEKRFKQEFMFIEIGAFLVLQVFRHPLHPLVNVVGEFTRNGQGDENVGGDAKAFRREVLLVEA
jgi:hypothetical protein